MREAGAGEDLETQIGMSRRAFTASKGRPHRARPPPANLDRVCGKLLDGMTSSAELAQEAASWREERTLRSAASPHATTQENHAFEGNRAPAGILLKKCKPRVNTIGSRPKPPLTKQVL